MTQVCVLFNQYDFDYRMYQTQWEKCIDTFNATILVKTIITSILGYCLPCYASITALIYVPQFMFACTTV